MYLEIIELFYCSLRCFSTDTWTNDYSIVLHILILLFS